MNIYSRVLVGEDEQILEYFMTKVPQCQQIEDVVRFLEALYYEQKIRITDKGKNIDKLKTCLEKQVSSFKNAEGVIKRMSYEIKLYKQLSEVKNLRHAGLYLDKDILKKSEDSEIYDWIVDIDLITNIANKGWAVKFSKNFFENSSEQYKLNVIGDKLANGDGNNLKTAVVGANRTMADVLGAGFGGAKSRSNKWEGAIVAVVGLYDKGKTFVLNNLSSSNLPSGKRVNTKGLSFKYVNVDDGTKLILLDTAGSYSPVKVQNSMSIIEREATEHFLLELVFDISDYFLFVVNDFTSLDQRYLDKLTRSLQNQANKSFREVIVIHNFKEVEGQDILEHIWETQVKQIYSDGLTQQTLVAAKNPLNGRLEEKKVTWFKSPFTRHVCLVNQDSILGLGHNPWTFSLLRYWLKAVLVPLNRDFSVVENVINFSDNKLSGYFKETINLTLEDTENPLNKKIVNKIKLGDKLRMPHISIDGSGFVVTRPDAFIPNVDIYRGENEYVIIIDIPGMKKEDITIYRQNVVTLVEGKRKRGKYDQYLSEKQYEKSERKFGDFAMTFKIPDEYERKWSYFEVEEGIMCIKYKRDMDAGDRIETPDVVDKKATSS